ncbi:MAG: ABC transporter ATP-binding protein [Clostridia bacterium]|nr:ABC transporter ATP-binding protein [Clostridia bacterium]
MKNIIFKGMVKYKWQVVAACILIGISSFAELLIPNIMNNIIDDGINKGNMQYLWKNGCIMLAVVVVGFLCQVVCTRFSCRIASGMTGDLIKRVYNKTDRMSYSQYAKIGPSALLTRTTDDVFVVGESVYFFIRIVVTLPIMLIGGIILSMQKDVSLSLALMAFAPIELVVVFFIAKKLMAIWTKSDGYQDDQNQLVRDRLSGIRVIRAYNREGTEHDKIARATNKMSDWFIKGNIIDGLIDPIALLILNIIIVIIMYVGGMKVANNSGLSAGDVFAITQYVSIMMNSILIFSFAIVFLPRIKVKCNRINEVLDLETKDDVVPSGEKLDGDLVMSNVTYHYEGSEADVLKGVNLKIEKGKTVAFIGGTGSGKSTCLQLMLSLFQPTSGELSFGKRYSELTPATIRDNISVVLQRSTIFSASIKENVRMGKPDATDKEIEEVCDIAEIKDFVEGLEEGYDHSIEQGGANLSGGQKQRIAIARAIVKDASLYIFDDSFSALDFLTESRLRKKLNERLKGKTQLIITQRISTAMSADYIYAFDNGEIVGEGNHKHMMENCALYRDIYNSQVGGDLSDR